MHLFFLAAGGLLLAAFLFAHAMAGRTGRNQLEPDRPRAPEPELSDQAAEAAAQVLGEAVEPLCALMAHPDLGGPGFLTVQFPAGERPTVSVQYPDINEGLYRRAVRQELDREELLAVGVPEALLDLAPAFTAEGSGVVQVAIQIQSMGPLVGRSMDNRVTRDQTLSALAAALERRYPALSVRRLGADLLLTPQGRDA